MKILVSDPLAESGIRKLQDVSDFEVEVNTSLTHEELLNIIKEYDALVIRSGTKATAEIIEAADRLKVIARAGIGLDNVDIGAATKRGIVVMNTPEGNVITTAEHAIAMMMAVTRNIPQASQSLKAGKWEKKRFRGHEVFNKVLGIIGIGRIGRVVAERAKGLKMNVIAYDPYINAELVERLGIDWVPLDELYARSDYITVHTPVTQETRNLIDAQAFAKMKKGVYLINCARGGIVNEEDLYEAVQGGVVAGAALDVFEREPPGDNRLLSLDRVIATPHLGASTDEAQENVAVAVADQVIDYLGSGTIRNAVNAPSIDGEDLARMQPYLTLTEKLGSLLAQITPGPVEAVSIDYIGDISSADTHPLTISALKGILTPVLGDEVNFVNASVHAKERNIKVTESRKGDAEDFTNLVSIRLKSSTTENTVAGTIFGKKDVRLVRLNEFRTEAPMEGHVLLIYSKDTPGTIGAIGVCLGKNKINIDMMDVGQVIERGENIVLVRTNVSVRPEAIRELLDIENVHVAQMLEL